MLNLDSIVQRNTDVISAEADKDIVMVSITNGSYYGVSDVGRDIWEGIEQPRKIVDLIDDLCRLYDIDKVSCQEQTLSFLQILLNEHLLQVRNEPSY